LAGRKARGWEICDRYDWGDCALVLDSEDGGLAKILAGGARAAAAIEERRPQRAANGDAAAFADVQPGPDGRRACEPVKKSHDSFIDPA
jgi:hypothetical protein